MSEKTFNKDQNELFSLNENEDKMMPRRQFIAAAAMTIGGVMFAGNILQANAWGRKRSFSQKNLSNQRYLIGVSDWMILKRQKLGAFQLSKDIGVDGIEVDMGGLGNRKTFDNKLTDPAIRKEFLNKASSLNLQICSLAMSAFFAQSFIQREGAVEMVKGCIDIMKDMRVKVAFLPMGVQGDLTKYPELRTPLIHRLQAVAPAAEKAGVIIGIETSLDARGEVKLLKDIGSPAIQSYFNFENPLQAGRNLEEELQILGKEHICQIHCTDKDGIWLQNDPLINMHQVKRTLDAMSWRGWLVMQRSRDAHNPHDVKKNYGTNAAFLKKIFQSA